MADILFEIGAKLIVKKDYTGAVHWLSNAHDLLAGPVTEISSNNAQELRSTIMQYLVRALSYLPGEQARRRAWIIADELAISRGSGISGHLVRLDLYELSPEATPQDYCDALLRLIQAIDHLTESAVNIVLQRTHKLRSRSPELAQTALTAFLIERLVDAETQWIERVLVTAIWNLTMSLDSSNDVSEPVKLQGVMDALSTGHIQTIGPLATHACQMVRYFLACSVRLSTDSSVSFYGNELSTATAEQNILFQGPGAQWAFMRFLTERDR